jgi:DNA-binding NarL/FixJ family response regulator
MINVIIADNQAIFRAGIAKVLAVEDDMRIVGQPQSPEQLLNALDKLRAHVLLFATIFLPQLGDIRLLASRQGTALLVLAETGQAANSYLQMGAQGVIYRSVNSPTVLEAVRRLARGEKFVHAPTALGMNEDIVGIRVRNRLSTKEIRIVAAVVRGYRNREVAELVGTSEQVVKNALRGIYDKIGVSDRLELALFVLNHRILAQATASVHLVPMHRRRHTGGPGRPPNAPDLPRL